MQDPNATDPGAQALFKALSDLAPGLVPYAVLGWIVIAKLRAIAVAADKLPDLYTRLDKIEGKLDELVTESKSQFSRIHAEFVSMDVRVARLEGRPQKPTESRSSWLLMGSDPLNLKGESK